VVESRERSSDEELCCSACLQQNAMPVKFPATVERNVIGPPALKAQGGQALTK
jgi:hypothetical protein